MITIDNVNSNKGRLTGRVTIVADGKVNLDILRGLQCMGVAIDAQAEVRRCRLPEVSRQPSGSHQCASARGVGV